MRIDQELKDKLQEEADNERRTLSNHIIWIIEKYFNEQLESVNEVIRQ